MRKRSANVALGDEPPCKRSTLSAAVDISPGEILTDVAGKQWRLGEAIGVGGFGEIFTASDDLESTVGENSRYVAKIESHSNGPLFVEINCYLRIAKEENLNKWKLKKGLKFLGMPHYVASGSHHIKGNKYRFLIIPRYETDLEDILQRKKHKLNMKTVLTLSLQLIDVLQYIHEMGFIHADIKASNILLDFKKKTSAVEVPPNASQPDRQLVRYLGNIYGPLRACRLARSVVVRKNLRSNYVLHCINDLFPTPDKSKRTVEKNDDEEYNQDRMYLLDYGLASKYLLSNDEHKQCSDQRRAHAGTITFCSRDAHTGTLARRSDLESLGYNIIYWLTANLPWIEDMEDPEIVYKKKRHCMSQLEPFLIYCFGDYPKFLHEYFLYLQKLDYDSRPDYLYCKKLFRNALKEYGFKNDQKFDLDKSNQWTKKPKKKTNSENLKCKKMVYVINRVPLKSNLPVKKVLRKKDSKNKVLCLPNWSKILMDPEMLLKQARERKLTESSDDAQSLSNLDIANLNPTEAMLEVYNNYLEKSKASEGCSPRHRGDSAANNIEGYTNAMMRVHNRMIERRELEMERAAVPVKTAKSKSAGRPRKAVQSKKKNKSKSTIDIRFRDKTETRSCKSSSRIYSLRG